MIPEFLCPVCRGKLAFNNARFACTNNHEYFFDGPVLILLDPDKKNHIDRYIRKYYEIKRNENELNLVTGDFDKLPFIKNKLLRDEWDYRKHSLKIIENSIGNTSNGSILEFGPYNGWLTNRLAENGFDIMAIDYFNEDLTGLRTIDRYKNKWLPVQIDLRDLSIIKNKFDFIIFNHSLHFFNSYKKIIEDVVKLLNENGKIIIIGSPFYKETSRVKRNIEKTFQRYNSVNGFNFGLFPGEFRGYFDYSDKSLFVNMGFQINNYKAFIFKNLLSKILKLKPSYHYLTYKNR